MPCIDIELCKGRLSGRPRLPFPPAGTDLTPSPSQHHPPLSPVQGALFPQAPGLQSPQLHGNLSARSKGTVPEMSRFTSHRRQGSRSRDQEDTGQGLAGSGDSGRTDSECSPWSAHTGPALVGTVFSQHTFPFEEPS